MRIKDFFILLTLVLGFSLLYYFTGKKNPDSGNSSLDLPENPVVKPTKKRAVSPNEEAVKVVKQTPLTKEADPIIKRLDPNANIDKSYKNQQDYATKNGYGSFPAIDTTKTNPQLESVAKALQNPKENSGAISIVGKREKFDLKKFKTNPAYYLETAEPGRAFDAATPGEGITRLTRIGNSTLDLMQNETITLQAQGSANMPISFVVFDGGFFKQNGLSFITVQADSAGIASVEFAVSSGVINQTRIRAASPVNSGTLEWIVNVNLNLESSNNQNK